MTKRKVLLINPPWAIMNAPSIALEQLSSVCKETRGLECDVEVSYLNQVFAAWIGMEHYLFIASGMESHNSGFGEWFFSQAAFPERADNWAAYRRRYVARFPVTKRAEVVQLVETVRPRLVKWLDDQLSGLGLEQHVMVGITSMFQQNTASIALARLIKRRHPTLQVVVGGANCEGPMGAELIHACPHIDFVCCGHALRAFPKLIEAVLRRDEVALQGIDGILTRENCRPASAGTNEPQLLGISEFGKERPLDERVPLEYDNFLASYARHLPKGAPRPELFFETSRGCWWGQHAHCTFCGLNGGSMAYRAMKPALAREYIERLVDRYSDRVCRYSSVDNILPKEYVSELFDGFEPRPGVSIFYEVKADLGQASLRTLAKAGVTEVQPGIEALYTPTLKLMRKGTSSMHNVSFLDDCNQLGVNAYWNLLIGFPGETADSYQHYERVIPDLHHLAPPSGAYPVRFDRFSPYFVEAKKYGLELDPLDFYSSVYPFSPDVLRHLAYYFSDRNYAAAYIRTVAAWVGPLNRLIADWTMRHVGHDGRPRATLHGTRDSAGIWTVVDTRSGETKHFVASAAVSKLIDRMQRPVQTDALAAELRPALDELRKRRLVFEERERAISLVRVGVHDSANRALAWQRESKPLGVVRQSDIAPSVPGPA